MQNLESVETSTQVGREDKNMSSQRERKSLNSVSEVPNKVYEDDYYDSEVVYPDEVDEDEDYWNRSFENIQELIDESEIPQEDNEE